MAPTANQMTEQPVTVSENVVAPVNAPINLLTGLNLGSALSQPISGAASKKKDDDIVSKPIDNDSYS